MRNVKYFYHGNRGRRIPVKGNGLFHVFHIYSCVVGLRRETCFARVAHIPLLYGIYAWFRDMFRWRNNATPKGSPLVGIPVYADEYR